MLNDFLFKNTNRSESKDKNSRVILYLYLFLDSLFLTNSLNSPRNLYEIFKLLDLNASLVYLSRRVSCCFAIACFLFILKCYFWRCTLLHYNKN